MTTRARVAGTLAARLVAVGVVCLAAGCGLKSPPTPVEVQQQALPTVPVPEAWAGAADPNAVADGWLGSFQDAQLSAAVAEAQLYNADLRAGAARVEQARLLAQQAGARLYPWVDVLARGGGKMSGDNSGLQGASLSLSWELDLWGRVRYGRAAATATAAAAEADFLYARQSIAALVAKSWFVAIEAGLQASVARTMINQQEALVRLAETRVRVGAGADDDVYLARVAVGTARDALTQIELGRLQAVRALELLIGRYPAGAAGVAPALPDSPPGVPAGLPSALLERRPDVVAAERRVAAAFNRVQEARAARLPAIALTSSVNGISSDLFVLQDRSNPVWSLGANLLAPIFRGGQLQTQVEIRTAEQQEAIAAYASVGLRAFGEVEQALSAEAAAREREGLLASVLSDQGRARELAETQFRVGTADLRLVTQRQLAESATRAALLRVQAEQRIQRVNLHLALGGSFDPPPPPPGGGTLH